MRSCGASTAGRWPTPPYNPTDFQPYYFVAPSFGAMHEQVTEFLKQFSE